jgi:hypothetical protein
MALLALSRVDAGFNRMREEGRTRVIFAIRLIPADMALHAEAVRVALRAGSLAQRNPGSMGGFPSCPVICRTDGTNVRMAGHTLKRHFYPIRILYVAIMT